MRIWRWGLACAAIWAASVGVGSGEELAPENDFVVHEWGTFTTFSGSDGVHLDYRPLDIRHSDLPSFVQDRARFDNLPIQAKARIRARVRMETPVTYFYTDKPRTVRVKVDFPEGMLTEFYPPVRSISPKFDAKTAYSNGELIGNSSADWGEIRLLPPSSFRPQIKDSRVASLIQDASIRELPPNSDNYPHYAYARVPDAAMVHSHVRAAQRARPTDHFERFLFYRGVGKFRLPIQVKFEGNDAVLTNDGDLPIQSSLLIDVQGETIRAAVVGGLAGHSRRGLALPKEASAKEVRAEMTKLLVAQGLFAAEAKAMVATWSTSWFTEQGTRLLYMVPETVTNQLIPLHITPAPKKMLRVLVGRLEMLTPGQEEAGRELVRKSRDEYEQYRKRYSEVLKRQGSAAARALTPPQLPQRLLALNRFAEPTLARVVATSQDFRIQDEAKRLIERLRTYDRDQEKQLQNVSKPSP